MDIQKALNLSPAQVHFLKHDNGPFHIGESLRKRGLYERLTTFTTGSEFADSEGVQSSIHHKPQPRHQWWKTSAGDVILEFVEKHQ